MIIIDYIFLGLCLNTFFASLLSLPQKKIKVASLEIMIIRQHSGTWYQKFIQKKEIFLQDTHTIFLVLYTDLLSNSAYLELYQKHQKLQRPHLLNLFQQKERRQCSLYELCDK